MSDMTFNNIREDTECEMPTDMSIDTEGVYLRRIPKSYLRAEGKDFKSEWERKPSNRLEKDCEKVSSLKGVSLQRVASDDSNLEDILKVFRTSLSIARNGNKYICQFKLSQQSGLVRHSPTPEKKDWHHHDLYKSDQFNLDELDLNHIRHIDEVEAAL